LRSCSGSGGAGGTGEKGGSRLAVLDAQEVPSVVEHQGGDRSERAFAFARIMPQRPALGAEPGGPDGQLMTDEDRLRALAPELDGAQPGVLHRGDDPGVHGDSVLYDNHFGFTDIP
jgi:hypothetical protein